MSGSSDLAIIPGTVRMASSDSGYAGGSSKRSNSISDLTTRGMTGLNSKMKRMNSHMNEVVESKGEYPVMTFHPKKKVVGEGMKESRGLADAREAQFREEQKRARGGPGSTISSVGQQFRRLSTTSSSYATSSDSPTRTSTSPRSDEPIGMILKREPTAGGKFKTVAVTDVTGELESNQNPVMDIVASEINRNKLDRRNKRSPPPDWLLPHLSTVNIQPALLPQKRARTMESNQFSNVRGAVAPVLRRPEYDLVSASEFGEIFARRGTVQSQARSIRRRPSTESIFEEQMGRIGLRGTSSRPSTAVSRNHEPPANYEWTRSLNAQSLDSRLDEPTTFETEEIYEDRSDAPRTPHYSPTIPTPMFDNRPQFFPLSRSPSPAPSLAPISVSDPLSGSRLVLPASDLNNFWKRNPTENSSSHIRFTESAASNPIQPFHSPSNPYSSTQFSLKSTTIPASATQQPLNSNKRFFIDSALEPETFPQFFEEVSTFPEPEFFSPPPHASSRVPPQPSAPFYSQPAFQSQNPLPNSFPPFSPSHPSPLPSPRPHQEALYKTPSPLPFSQSATQKSRNLELDQDPTRGFSISNHMEPINLNKREEFTFTFSQIPTSQAPIRLFSRFEELDGEEYFEEEAVNQEKEREEEEVEEIEEEIEEVEEGIFLRDGFGRREMRSPGQRRRNGNLKSKSLAGATFELREDGNEFESGFEIFEDPIEEVSLDC